MINAKIALIAGEPSGDMLGAKIIKKIKAYAPNTDFYGIGGDNMINEGFKSILPIEDFSYMGFTDVLRQYKKLQRYQKQIIETFIKTKPAMFIGVDYSSFNLGVSKALKSKNIKTIQYICPKVWAWNPNRIAKIKNSVDKVLCLFPFEEDNQ